jgi:hypothetical protein
LLNSYASDKGPTTRISKKVNSQGINDPMKKWGNELDRNFSKKEA